MSHDTSGTDGRTIPSKFVLSTAWDCAEGDSTLCCPECGWQHVHIGSVQVLQGHQTTTVRCEDTRTEGSSRHQRKRGSAVAVCFWGECGHRWSYTFEFRKGITTVATHAMPKRDPAAPVDELWRD